MSSGGGSSTSTSTMNNVPAYAQPYVQAYLQRASAIAFNAEFDSYFTQYAAPTYADINDPLYPDEIDGINALASRGRNGNATIIKGDNHVKAMLDGDYLLGTKPEFQSMLDNVTGKPNQSFADDVRPELGGSCYLVGDLSAENKAYDLTANIPARYNDRTLAKIYSDNYRAERKYQDDSLPAGLEFVKQVGDNADMLRKAGLHYRVWLQGYDEDNYKKWFEGEALEVARVEVLGNAIRALVGTQTTKTEPYYRPNKMVGVVGGAMAGAAMGAPLGPYGMAAGAIIGGIVGGL